MSKSVDEAVLDLLKKVQSKKDEIEKLKVRPQWKTNCSFGTDPNSSQRTNIQTIRDVNKLVEIHAFLTVQENSTKQSAKELGVNYDGTWFNYSFDDWKDDIRTKLGQLQLENKQKELKELDDRVNKLVSPEQRRSMELDQLQKILGA